MTFRTDGIELAFVCCAIILFKVLPTSESVDKTEQCDPFKRKGLHCAFLWFCSLCIALEFRI